jgi:hypothetical protein
VGGKKRGVLIVSLLVCVLLVVLFSHIVVAGYCGNPAETDYFCGEADSEDCCPADADTDYYGEDDSVPLDQSDCESNWYDGTDDTVGGICDNVGYCYLDSEATCDSSITAVECAYYYGEWGETEDDVLACVEGCCLYDDGTGSGAYNTYELTNSGYCDAIVYTGLDAAFIEGQSESECTDLGADYVAGTYECFDGIDNDGDGYTDYPADDGCSDHTDSSEDSASNVCADGEDNDGDGYTDYGEDDGCCESADTESEELCDYGTCGLWSSGDDALSSACNCIAEGEDESSGTYCPAGNYCVDGVCESDNPDAECTPGQVEWCGSVDADECLEYKTCADDETWGSCAASDYCGTEPEVCYDGTDEDGDELVDCQDIDCYETYCGTSSGDCDDYGFEQDDGSGNYVCCSTTNVQDCDGDGTIDTCGTCDCLQTPLTPEIDEIIFENGAKQLTIEWDISCSVELNILRCAGDDCPDSYDEDATADEIKADYVSITSPVTNTGEYTDTTIDVNTRYCYIVQALYSDHGGDDTYSQPLCIDDSGDAWCHEFSTEFCLDSSLEMSGSLRYSYACNEENQLVLQETCDSDEICIGPYDDGTTSCEYQSDCQSCGDPLGLYAIYDPDYGSVIFNDDDDDYGQACYELPMCYFDYTQTTINNFHECGDITSCYDYQSKSSCEGQDNGNGFTNKCLQRNCAWTYLGGEDDDNVAHGICKETSADYASCNECNSAEHNGIFDACTQDRCTEFGVDDATCYLSGLTGECTDVADYTCTAYSDSESCMGGVSAVVLDADTNEITTPSLDSLNLGICYWNGDECYKDANGDEEMDDQQEDMTAPSTTILSSDKMRAIEISILATDTNSDGSSGSGVKSTFYCIDDGSGCELDITDPDEDDYEEVELDAYGIGTIEDGDGSGEYTLYYYSEDYAENLEIVNEWIFDVDKAGPEIVISYYVGADTEEPYDGSSLTFEVTLDEEAYCTDSFDGGEGRIDEQYNDHFVVKFEGLTDGWYTYSIDCTDAIGNDAEAFVFAHLDADTSVFDAQPEMYVDYADVTLTVKTFDDVACGFSYNEEEEAFADMDYGFSSSDEGDYYLHTEDWTLEEGNGLYFFDVKCELSDGTEADDEIQFVYDDTAPETDVVDSYGDDFDFAAYYEGEDIDIYLDCIDEPEFGFGCDSTYYCVDGSQCTPDTAYDTTDSITYGDEEDEIDSFFICYYSNEQTYDSMGGLTEDIQCTEMTIDYYDPSLEITHPEDGEIVYIPYVTVEGEVDDPDASSTTAINTIEITLVTGDGEEVVYDDIDASDGTFSQLIEGLSLSDSNSSNDTSSSSYNTIYVKLIDRSGATAEDQVDVLYTSSIEGDVIWIEEPANGVTDEAAFDFIVGTFLEAEICGYSKATGISFENYISLEAVASDTSGEYLYGASYSIDESKDGIAEYVYVTCELVNGVQYSATFTIEYDSTAPEIEDLYIENSDGKEPPSVVESPLDPVIVVETDDPTLCKYSIDSDEGFSTGMTKFDSYDDGEFSTTNTHTIEELSDQTDYTVYVACQNGAYSVSDSESLSFTIDSTAASDMYLIEPEVTSERTFSISLGTTRTASSCTYGDAEDAVDVPMTDAGDQKQWDGSSITVTEDGVYTYYFSCWFVDGEMTDYFDVIVDTSGPEIDWIEDGDVSYSATQLSASWSATDDLTEVVGYQYSIGTRAGYTDVVNWSNTTDDEVLIDELNLTNQSTYYWNVQAYNELDLASNVDSSDGVLIDESGNGVDPDLDEDEVGDVDYSTCSNDQRDDDETDIDCGGDCDACADGYSCDIDDDCISDNCDSGYCAEATCTDLIQNQGESDVDCGGNYCDPCLDGYICVYHRDCDSGYCQGKVCTAASCDDSVKNGDEDGIDCGGSCPDICEEVVVQSDPSIHTDDDDENGLGWFGWLLILMLLVGLGIGGYYGYLYYLGKTGKLPPKGLPGLKSLPGLGKNKLPPLRRPGMKRPALSSQQRMKQMALAKGKARQQKQAGRSRLLSAFDQEKSGGRLALHKPAPKVVVAKTPVSKGVVSKEKSPAKPAVKEKAVPTKKLGEDVKIREPVKKKKSQTFNKLDELIKKRKKR